MSAEPTSLSCPQCGATLVIRENGTTGDPFLGCERYPDCKHREPLPAHLEMRRAGADALPGFGL